MASPVCVVAGFGPGNGAAFTNRFAAEGYRVAMLARSEGPLREMEAALPAAKDMLASGRGAIIAIGATASVRGGSNFAAFASSRAAMRSLAQSMARSLGPKRIHVAHVVIEGAVDTPRIRAMIPGQKDEVFLKPDAIADSVFHLARQDRSAWTFELDLRPFQESW